MRLHTLSVVFISLIISTTVSAANSIQKSANDSRQYESFTLENDLSVLVISDPQTTKAAASLNVTVGSANNPDDRPGLAHFLEHMLFLGTKKYPQANEYSSFIDSHGGSQNAFTSQDNTNYYFDIKQDSLEEALDRFSQFFIAPLFSNKYTEREKKAVHSEYQSRLKDDAQRNYSAFKQIMNPAHPGSRFFIGSLESLSDNDHSKIRDDLITFYQQQYSANRMTLVVLGKESLPELKQLATKYFSTIKNRQLENHSITVNRMEDSALPMIFKVQTLKDFRLLTLTFPTNSTRALYTQKPLGYISSIVGYEGEGSLIAYLKAQGLANGLSASNSDESDVESAFQTSISLTEKGLAQTDTVIENFFYFIKKLKEEGLQASLYEEESRLSQQAFEYIPKQSPASYVVTLSQRMKKYPEKNWINAPYLLEQFNAESIARYAEFINPENMLVNIQARSVEVNKTEPYFGAQYSSSGVTQQQLAKWQSPKNNPELFIRKQNPYIAEDLSLIKQETSEANNSVVNHKNFSKGVNLWHLQDKEFLTPKSTLYFGIIRSPSTFTSRETISLSLYTRLLNDTLNKQLYDAGSAGLFLDLYAHRRGISVKISGYSDKQALLFGLLNNLPSPTFDKNRFDIIKENYRRSLINNLQDKPYEQLFDRLSERLLSSPSIEDKLKTLSKITLNDIQKTAHSLFETAELRILSHGNIDWKGAQVLAQLVIDKLPIKQTVAVPDTNNVFLLNNAQNLSIEANIDNSDSAVIWYLQGKDTSYAARASTSLLTEVLATDYSNQLRTEQQLGYLVFATGMNVQKMPGIALVVQSPNATIENINSSNNSFTKSVAQTLVSLTPEQLSTFKQSLIARYQNPERTIYQRSNRLWSELNYKILTFDEKESLVSAIKELSIEDLRTAWQSLLNKKIILTSNSNNSVEKNQSEKSKQ
jgi:secreted Zn-dependent insulinase-like peptidase